MHLLACLQENIGLIATVICMLCLATETRHDSVAETALLQGSPQVTLVQGQAVVEGHLKWFVA